MFHWPNTHSLASPRCARGILLLLLFGLSAPAMAGPSDTEKTAKSGSVDTIEAYSARLREALPQSWLEQEFRRQRSFSALARSRQLAAAGKYDEATEELKNYLGSDPDDLTVQFEYLVLTTNLKQYRAAITAADKFFGCKILLRLGSTAVLPGRRWATIGRRCRTSRQPQVES